MADQFRATPTFLTHVPCHPHGTDPSRNNKAFNQPTPKRQTASMTWVYRGPGRAFNGRLAGAATGASAQITCTVANVEPGKQIIRVGDYELRPGVDFAVGVTDAALATNLAAAIDRLPGFDAPAPGANIVTVTTSQGTASDVRFEVIETSAASAFAVGALTREGLMNQGAPAPAAPLFT